MKLIIVRSQEEIDELLNQCAEAEARGKTAFRGMTYEQGIQEAIKWLVGESNTNPLSP